MIFDNYQEYNFMENEWEKTFRKLLSQMGNKNNIKWSVIQKIYILCKASYHWYKENKYDEKAVYTEYFYRNNIKDSLILEGNEFSKKLLLFSINTPFSDYDKTLAKEDSEISGD